jgi:hypothetical protein
MNSNGLIVMEIQRLGVPTGMSVNNDVRDRAKKLAEKHPDFYQMDPSGSILWCMTIDDNVYKPIYDWVLYNQGNEPN